MISPFEGNINPGGPHGIKPYLQEKNEIEKEAEKLDILVSNYKDNINNVLSV